jgi:hypothetical protein
VNVQGLLPFESGLLANAACFVYNSCPAVLHCEHYEGVLINSSCVLTFDQYHIPLNAVDNLHGCYAFFLKS